MELCRKQVLRQEILERGEVEDYKWGILLLFLDGKDDSLMDLWLLWIWICQGEED